MTSEVGGSSRKRGTNGGWSVVVDNSIWDGMGLGLGLGQGQLGCRGTPSYAWELVQLGPRSDV